MLVRDLVGQVRHKLYGSFRTERNRLALDVSDSATTLDLAFTPHGATKGAYIGINDEVLYIWNRADTGTNRVNVSRGEFGTTPQAHAVGDIVEVNPRFPLPLIVDAMREEIESWPRELYQVAVVDLTFDADGVVDLSDLTGLTRVLRVLGEQPDGSYRGVMWQERDGALKVVRHQLRRSANIRVHYSLPFDTSTFTLDTDLITDVGLSRSLGDVVVLGACWRLFVGRDALRTYIESQGDSRRGDEVPVGGASGVLRTFEALRSKRLDEEVGRLVAEYGYIQRGVSR